MKKNKIFYLLFIALFFFSNVEKSVFANEVSKEIDISKYRSISELLQFDLSKCDEQTCLKYVKLAVKNKIPYMWAMDMSSPLIEATKKDYYKLTKYLIKHDKGDFINVQASQFGPPLFWAIQNGNVKMVKLLLKNGADADGHTCEHLSYFYHVQFFIDEKRYSEEIGNEIKKLLLKYSKNSK